MLRKIDYFFRRAAAYSIDILLISIVINSLVTSSKVNFQVDDYNKYYSEYYQMYLSYYEHNYNNGEVKTCDDFKNAIDTYKLTEDKYVSKYEELNESLEDEKITKEEFDKNCSSLVNEYQEDVLSKDEFKEKENYYTYHLEKNYVVAYIINFVITLLYFVLFQGFTYGQTLGKKIMRLKVVTDEGERVSYKQLLIRSVFLFSIIYYVLETIAIFVVPIKYFLYIYNSLLFLNSLLSIIIIISIIISKNSKGLHGLVSKTKVILIDFKGNEIDLETGKSVVELEEEKKLEEEENKKKTVRKKTKKTSSKTDNKSK